MGAAYLTNGTCYMDNDDKLLDLWALYFKQIHANPISVSMFNPNPRISIFSFYSFYLCKYSPQISEIFSNTVPDSSTQCSMYGISTNIKKSPSFVGFYKPYISYMEHLGWLHSQLFEQHIRWIVILPCFNICFVNICFFNITSGATTNAE